MMRAMVWGSALLLVPQAAHAVEAEYWAYGSFSEVVAAFTRLALIFDDAQFLAAVTVLAAASIGIAMLKQSHDGMMSGQFNINSIFIPAFVGLATFKALVLSTGTMHIYDPVKNRYQSVADVPDLVVILAGGFNEVERGIVDIIDTTSIDDYSDTGGSALFALLNISTQARTQSIALERSLSEYYNICGTWALAHNYNGVTDEEFYRTTTDMAATFAKFATPALYVTYFPAGSGSGTTLTCAQAWSKINTDLSSTSGIKAMRIAVCEAAGYDTDNANEKARCIENLDSAASLFGNGAATSEQFLEAILFAQRIQAAWNSDDFSGQQSQLSNRQVMAEAFGASQAMDQWIPQLRGYMTATVLGLTPLLLMFVMTPLIWNALTLTVGLYAWLALWGMADAASMAMAQDAARHAMYQIISNGLGVDSIINLPTDAVKALGIFGNARAMGMGLATMLTAALFKFSGYAMSSFGQGAQQHVQQAGEAAGRQTLLTEERARTMQGAMGAATTYGSIAENSLSTSIAAMAQGALQTGNELNATTAHGYEVSGMRHATASIAAGQQVGSVQGAGAAQTEFGGDAFKVTAEASQHRQARSTSDDIGANRAETATVGGPAKAGAIEGTLRGTDAAVSLEASENLSGKSGMSVEDATQLQRQRHSHELGATQASHGKGPDRAIEAARVGSEIDFARQKTLGDNRMTPEQIGTTEGQRQANEAEGYHRAQQTFGDTALTEGSQLSYSQSAAHGELASETPGGVAAHATRGAMSSVAGIEGEWSSTAAVAKFLGLDPDLAGFTEAKTQGALAQEPVAINDQNMEQTLGRLRNANLITPEAEMAVRKNHGGFLYMSLGEDGKPIQARVQSGGETYDVHTFDKQDGRKVWKGDMESTTMGRELSVTGGRFAAADKPFIARSLMEAFEGHMERYDVINGGQMDAFTNLYSDSLQRQGLSLHGQESHFTNRELSGGLSGRLGLPESMSPVSGGANVDIHGALSWQTSANTTTDAAIMFNKTQFAKLHEQGIRHAEQTFGHDWASNPEGQWAVADFMAAGMVANNERLSKAADADAAASVSKSEAIGDVEKRLERHAAGATTRGDLKFKK